jgi:hypothetical protein
MKTISTLIIMLFVVGCSHTTHMSPSEDGKTAWIAQDSIMLIFTTSKKYYCIADPVKPRCIQTIDIEPTPEPEPDNGKPKNIFF